MPRPKSPRVGYRNPPLASQFKPGQSGNPKGRPKGSKNEATILRELLYRKIPVNQGGKIRKITVLEAILLRFTEDSLKGNTKSAAFLLNRQRAAADPIPESEDLTTDDRDVLEAFADELIAKGRKK
jgi:hypothetical protein